MRLYSPLALTVAKADGIAEKHGMQRPTTKEGKIKPGMPTGAPQRKVKISFDRTRREVVDLEVYTTKLKIEVEWKAESEWAGGLQCARIGLLPTKYVLGWAFKMASET